MGLVGKMLGLEEIKAIDKAIERVLADYPPDSYRYVVGIRDIAVLERHGPGGRVRTVAVYNIRRQAYEE